MLEKSLELIKNRKPFLDELYQINELLYNSHLLKYLHAAGQGYLKGAKDMNAMALGGARAEGWYACLEAIISFKEKVYSQLQDTTVETPRPDFGGLDKAVGQGDLTEEEANAIRTGQQPDYTSAIKSAGRAIKQDSPH